MNNDDGLTNKYKKYVSAGFLRVFLSRLLSIISIGVSLRLIPVGILGISIALSSGTVIINRIVDFGIPWAAKQRGISGAHDMEVVVTTAVHTMVKKSIPVSLIIGSIYYYYIIKTTFLSDLHTTKTVFTTDIYFLYILTLILSILLVLIKTLEDIYLRSQNVVIMNTIYSISTSVLVPLIYYYYNSLSSIVMAWVISQILSIIPYTSKFINLLGVLKRKYSKTISKDILVFALPLYLISLPKTFAIEFENQLIFNQLGNDSTALFYYAYRLVGVASEVILIMIIGIFPLFTKKFAEDKVGANKILVSGSKLYIFISFVASIGLYINADWLVPFVFGVKYTIIIPTVKILSLSLLFNSFVLYIYSSFSAQGLRRIIVYSFIVELSTKMGFELLLLPYGINGVAIGSLLAKITLFAFVFYFSKPLRSGIRGFYRLFFSLITISVITYIFYIILNWLSLSILLSITLINSFFMIISYLLYRFIKPFDENDLILLKKLLPAQLHFIL